jgi:hypothetical protein
LDVTQSAQLLLVVSGILRHELDGKEIGELVAEFGQVT